MANVYTLECDPTDEHALSLVDSRPKECSSPVSSPDHIAISLPLKYRLGTAGPLDSSPPQPSRASPNTKVFQDTAAGFVPPVRPSSTPYPFADTKETPCSAPSNLSLGLVTNRNPLLTAAKEDTVSRPQQVTHFINAPVEVHEAILDHLLGPCVPLSPRSGLWSPNAARGFAMTARSSRRREMTQLALVNRTWRYLVQKRLYRHIKLQGTISSIDQAIVHFADAERLAFNVRHIEIWFPVFQPRNRALALSNTSILPTFGTHGLSTATYPLPDNNCVLQDVFRFVSLVLPQAKILTLEGGERRKAPKVIHFHNNPYGLRNGSTLPIIHSITTLVTKGQWNLMRDNQDFESILGALPNLEDWQGAYSKPKSKSYITISRFIPHIPSRIKNLSLCLESDYRREAVLPSFYAKAAQQTHICTVLGKILPRLEQFSYTGRVCHHFFETANQSAVAASSRMRSIDVTLKNCCRQSNIFHDSGSGIQDMGFIDAFEKLVIAGIRSLGQFQRVEYLRIRFVDLDSILPALNPYFLFQRGVCSGVWSDRIINELAKARPNAKFLDLSETFGNISYTKEGRIVVTPEYPRTRITSLKLANYHMFSNRVVAV